MGQKKIKFEDREVILPFERATGAEIKAQLGIHPDRQLVSRSDEGPRIVGNLEQVEIRDDTEWSDIPRHSYGGEGIGAPAVPEVFALRLGTRRPVRSLGDLGDLLNEMTGRELLLLTDRHGSPITDWVEEVLGEAELAMELREDPTRLGMMVALSRRLRDESDATKGVVFS